MITLPRTLFTGRGVAAARWASIMLRVAFGLTMVTHGLPKLLGRAHGSMADPMTSSVRLIEARLSLPFAPEVAIAITLLEAVGGFMIAAGLATRLLALAFAGEMIGIAITLGPTWPWIDRGIEYPVILFFVAATIATSDQTRLPGGMNNHASRMPPML